MACNWTSELLKGNNACRRLHAIRPVILPPAMESHACNVCQSSMQGMAYRTDCHHLLCPSCAQSSFQNSHSCPSCATYLKPENISEVMIGLKVANIGDQLFQHVLSGEGIHDASARMESIFQTLQEISAFISVQLTEHSKRWALAYQQLESHALEKDSELVRLADTSSPLPPPLILTFRNIPTPRPPVPIRWWRKPKC